MQTILTLRLDAALIERAKRYSRLRHKSVSQLVADYFALLNADTATDHKPLPPLTRSLLGVVVPQGAELAPEVCRAHLLEKYMEYGATQ